MPLPEPYPDPTQADVATFRRRGFVVVRGAVPPSDLADLAARCDAVHEPGRAMDTSTLPAREDGVVEHALQSTLELVWLEWRTAPFHDWTRRHAEALLGRPLAYWFNQLLFKPPRIGTATVWHQDDAYLGGSDDDPDRLVSCWLPLHDVDETAGCMAYLDGGHRLGLLPELMTRDGGFGPCDDPDRAVSVPLRAGDIVFHHGRTPHRAGPNTSDRWRNAVIQRFLVPGAAPTVGH